MVGRCCLYEKECGFWMEWMGYKGLVGATLTRATDNRERRDHLINQGRTGTTNKKETSQWNHSKQAGPFANNKKRKSRRCGTILGRSEFLGPPHDASTLKALLSPPQHVHPR